ncbi:Uncharacterized protein HZ326_26899 [Fusarium oxysporum f. sp. albedinis]|nr:Uncharacterized protein HZ326_26899 [Fusarium oxysporum f. sp. albedinis]
MRLARSRSAHFHPSSPPITSSLSESTKFQQRAASEPTTSVPEQYKRSDLKATIGCQPELSLPRAALHHLLAAKSLRGDFVAYHE